MTWNKLLARDNVDLPTISGIDIVFYELAREILNDKEKELLELAPYVLFFKDWRDDVRRKHTFEWAFLFDQIAKHFEVERDDLGYLTLQEIKANLKSNKLELEKIKLRKITHT